jgi:hypothetical protein
MVFKNAQGCQRQYYINPKSEARNPKQTRMTEIQMTETPKESVLNIEEFGFWSLFAADALRTVQISDLRLTP